MHSSSDVKAAGHVDVTPPSSSAAGGARGGSRFAQALGARSSSPASPGPSSPLVLNPATPGGRHGAHWASIGEAGVSAGLWFLYWVYCLAGRRVFHLLLWPVAWYFAAMRRTTWNASREYLERVGVLTADAGLWTRWRRVTRHVFTFADVLLDKLLVWSGALDLADARIEHDERFEADVRSGRGGVLVVAHLGNLEALRALGTRLPQLRMKILVHTRHAQRFNRVMTRLNPASAANLLQVTDLDAALAAELAASVERGEFVVIAADRVPVSGPARTLALPFLGHAAPFPIGPWVLAAALGCRVYWLACLNEPHPDPKLRKRKFRYTLQCELLSERVRLPRGDRAKALQEIMAIYVARLEAGCLRAPYAWFNFYPFWSVTERTVAG